MSTWVRERSHMHTFYPPANESFQSFGNSLYEVVFKGSSQFSHKLSLLERSKLVENSGELFKGEQFG